MTELVWRFGVAAEDDGGFTIATRLADRVLCEEVHDWIEAEQLDHQRAWTDPEGECGYLDLHVAMRRARRRFVGRSGFSASVHGKFGGEAGKPDARMFRAALVLFKDAPRPPVIVVIARDMDSEPAKREGFAQAQAAGDWPFIVVLAGMQPESEAWRLPGFVPRDDADEKALTEARAALGFDPTREPERLTHGRQTDPKDAKRWSAHLLGDDPDREARCLEAPLDRLTGRGEGCGLQAYLDDVREALKQLR
ncbi:MAG: hypothetical protein H6739_12585 [Alphaproteobacteria bacterium]|nr:hypothetical protein [Alphaproteobacteria bacterium]